jgi:acyl-homoserine-lactone acylase
MDAWAAGLNYYLHTHPEVEPRVLDRFEPWMALTFTEGSIGGDITRVSLRELEAFYETDPESRLRAGGSEAAMAAAAEAAGESFEPTGSNGISIAPANTADGNALLLINPHTSFFFRHEAHVRSDEGLNAYGALTWGQFFVYQGFNETAGWMHTSSRADNIDEFLETVVVRGDSLFYVYGDEERPVENRQVTIRYRTDSGMAEREFTVYRTHHGPIVREADGKWVATALMEKPIDALIQSYTRTKAANLEEYLEIMELHTNSSNNTLFADAEGNIAYLHSNFVPVRSTLFDYDEPVDGSDPDTDWQGVHAIDESPNAINPSVGWAFCTNNWPYSAAGPDSPREEDYPPYMDRGTENSRGVHALMLLDGVSGLSMEGLRGIAYDSYLPAFEEVVPAVVEAYDAAPASSSHKAELAGPVDSLRAWDLRWGVESVPTALAVFYGTELVSALRANARAAQMSVYDYMSSRATDQELLEGLSAAVDRLEEDFGTWLTPWGQINRFQRLTGDIVQDFDDDAPSTPVGFTSSRWGSLASFGARPYPGTNRWYGTSGNSFVAVVEFGDSLRAIAVTAGGLSNDPTSPHFNDQAERYATGNLREVYFYPEDIQANAEREYHPGG